MVQFLGTPVDSYNDSYADNLSLTLSTALPSPLLAHPVSKVPAYDHVFVVQMENTNFSQVIGDTTDAPFINALANRGTLLTNDSGTYRTRENQSPHRRSVIEGRSYRLVAGARDYYTTQC